MSKYYFLSCLFPPLKLGESPEISFEELSYLLEMNLSQSDLKKVAFLKRFIDLKNLRALWRGEPLDHRGNYTEKQIDEALSGEGLLPDFLADFLQQYESTEDRLKNFAFLWVQYFSERFDQGEFLKKYFGFERELSLVLAVLRAKDTKRDVMQEMQFEDPQDPFVAHILAQKDLDHYDPLMEYAPVKELYMQHKNDPLSLHKAILEYRLNRVIELEQNREFTIDSVLSYMVRLIIVEDFDRLNPDKGKQILEGIA